MHAGQALPHSGPLTHSPPEVALEVTACGHPVAQPNHDVWGAGLILFEGLSARPLFPPPGDTQNILACAQHTASYPWEVAEGQPPAWPMVAHILTHVLSRQPAVRPQAATVLQELQQIRAQCG